MLRSLPYLYGKERYLRVSPSAISTALHPDDGCPRKYYYQSVLGHWRPASKSSKIGNDVHEAIENGLTGKDINVHGTRLGAIAAGAIRTIPGLPDSLEQGLDPADGWGVETRCDFPCHPLVPFTCRVDLHRDGWIRDWKTTSNKSFRWAKTSYELAEDVQLLSNAYVLLASDPPDMVEVEHANVYVGAGRPKIEVVPAITPWSQVEDTWFETVVPAATFIAKLYQVAVPENETPKLKYAERVPYGPESACTSYNRPCEFTSICSACPASRITTRLPNMENII